MKEIADVLNSMQASRVERLKAQKVFLKNRRRIWSQIQAGRFPKRYVSGGRTYVGAPRRTAIKCDFLRANKIALGRKYVKDDIADLAQRDLLFSVLRSREVFPHRTGSKFYCCPRCTGKLYECVSANIFHYIDNAKWKREIEAESGSR